MEEDDSMPQIPPIIPLPIETLKPFLNKRSVNLKELYSIKNIMSIYETGCGTMSSEIFNLIMYINHLNNATDHPYRDMAEGLVPYLPYFIYKDSSDLLSIYGKNLMTFQSTFASTFDESTTVEDVQLLLEFSKFNPIYGSFFAPNDTATSHHFTIYNGKICTSWGDIFYVLYVEKEISAEDLKFLLQYKGVAYYIEHNEDLNGEKRNRYRRLMEKYFFDIDNYFYFSLKDMFRFQVYSEGFNVEHLDAVEICILLTGWLYSNEDNINVPDNKIAQQYEIVKNIVLSNRALLIMFFQNYGIHVNINQTDSNDKMMNTLKDAMADFETVLSEMEEDEDAVEGYKRKRVLKEFLQLCGITDEPELDAIIDYYYETLTYYENFTLYKIIKDRALVDQRDEAVRLYHQIQRESLSEDHERMRQLSNNAFYKAYVRAVNDVITSNRVGLTFISTRSIQGLSADSMSYHYRIYDAMVQHEIIEHYEMISPTVVITNPYAGLDVYTNYYDNMLKAIRDPSRKFQYKYIALMEQYGGNVAEIIRNLNRAYELLGLNIHGINEPNIIEITNPAKCIRETTKMKTRSQTRQERLMQSLESAAATASSISPSLVPYALRPSITAVPRSQRPMTRAHAKEIALTKGTRTSSNMSRKLHVPKSSSMNKIKLKSKKIPTSTKKYRIKLPKSSSIHKIKLKSKKIPTSTKKYRVKLPKSSRSKKGGRGGGRSQQTRHKTHHKKTRKIKKGKRETN